MSESTASSTTSSTPSVLPQEVITQDILNNIANTATGYANQLFNWGQGVFNNLSGDISGIMGKLDTAATTAMTGTTQAMNEFTNGFIPDYNSLRTEAGQYANAGRQSRNAGMAESDQMQANRSAMNDALQKLEGMGVDTSSGRYAHDLLTAETGGAAAAAGAGTQSIRNDEQTALGLQKQALDYGIQMPGIAANFLNAANNARSIAGNLDIGKVNAGTALMQVPNAYLNTAMMDKYPPTSQTSRGQSSSQSSRPNPGGQGGRNANAQGPAMDRPTGTTFNGVTHGTGNGDNGNGNGVFNPRGGGYVPPGYLYPKPDALPPVDPGAFDTYDNSQIAGPNVTGGTALDNFSLGGQYDPNADYYGGFNTGYDPNSGTNLSGYDPNASYANSFGTGNPADSYASFDNGSGFSSGPNVDYNQQFSDNSSAFDNSSTFDTGASGFNTDYTMPSSNDTSSYDSSGFNDYTNQDTYTGDYAQGGAIPTGPTQGGFVPQQASPSNGQNTDDIHASLNANEFVIPRDVSLWKGQEFFQKLIAQSRKNLATAGARGKPAPAPTGPVRFASRPVGA
jgi:hypothetical protein